MSSAASQNEARIKKKAAALQKKGARSLCEHAREKGAEIQFKYGPSIDWLTLLKILDDRSVVRYPCELVFSDLELQPGEFAYPKPKGNHPNDGFIFYIHPHFRHRLEEVPYLVFYHIVAVNYGEFASREDAETFGAAAMGVGNEEYYQTICRLADELDADSGNSV